MGATTTRTYVPTLHRYYSLKAGAVVSRLYAWVRTTGKNEPDGWAHAQTHVRLLDLLDTLEIEYTHKGRSVYFTLPDNQMDFWSVNGDSFLEEFFVIKNLTVCKSSIRLLSQDDEFAFMLMTSEYGYVYDSINQLVRAVYKDARIPSTLKN